MTSAFLLRNPADLKQGLAEMRRLSRPGGREAYTYLPQSVDHFLPHPGLCALTKGVGLRGVKYRRLGLGTVTVHTAIA